MFSYGEIDCRCHSDKFRSNVESLSIPYAKTILDYVAEFETICPTTCVLPIALAVPPATDQGYNPEAPFIGKLSSRVETTDLLNKSLEAACLKYGVAFTGADTWDFAKNAAGALRRELSDLHVHIESSLCGPVH